MTLYDFLTILGAIALAAMLDAIVKPDKKKAVGAWLGQLATRSGRVRYSGTGLLDRIFGPAILDWRVAPRYAMFSLGSIAVSYAIAYLTSPPEVQRGMWIFPTRPDFLDLALVAVCFLAAVGGDVLSYAQTRLFVRQIDKTRNVVVAGGLVAADLVVSLSIFLTTFSIARLACMLLVLNSSPGLTLSGSERFAPELLRAGLARAQMTPAADDGRFSRLAFAAANSRTEAELATLAAIVKAHNISQIGNSRSIRDASYTATRACIPDLIDVAGQKNAADDSGILLSNAFMERFDHAHPEARDNHGDDYLRAYLSGIQLRRDVAADYVRAARTASEDQCSVDVTTVRVTLPMAKLLAAAGPFNAWSAAFERTMYDTYSVAGFKFSPYISFDPYNSLPQYTQSIKGQLSHSILGAFPVNRPEALFVASLNDPMERHEGSARVPFSPMAASSLTTFLFLLIYLLGLTLAGLRAHTVRVLARIAPNFDTERAIFSVLTMATIVVVGTGGLAIWLLQVVWRWLLVS